MLPPHELAFIREASESQLFAEEEIKIMAAKLSTQVVSLNSLIEQERILTETNDLIDRHAKMLVNYPSVFSYLTQRQAAQTSRLREMRQSLTLKMNGRDSGESESGVSLGSRVSKGSNQSRVAGASTAGASTSSDIPGFRSLPTPRMGGGLT